MSSQEFYEPVVPIPAPRNDYAATLSPLDEVAFLLRKILTWGEFMEFVEASGADENKLHNWVMGRR